MGAPTTLFKISELWNVGISEILFYISGMSRFIHPNLADVPLASVLYALSDPTRLEIVRRLDKDRNAKGEGLSCSCAAPEGLPRATMSNHFDILRSAGLIQCRKEGTKVISRLRRADLNTRFPGLLDAVLHAEAA